MPYCTQMERQRMSSALESLCAAISVNPAESAGQITWIITKLIARFFSGRYYVRATGFGVLECAKMELYRRRDAVKEDEAIKKNGDVEELKETT